MKEHVHGLLMYQSNKTKQKAGNKNYGYLTCLSPALVQVIQSLESLKAWSSETLFGECTLTTVIVAHSCSEMNLLVTEF